jgi:hypothetical protein
MLMELTVLCVQIFARKILYEVGVTSTPESLRESIF